MPNGEVARSTGKIALSTNVIISKCNSMMSPAKTKNGSLVDVGCLCHFLRNTRQNAVVEFTEVNGFAREDDYDDLFTGIEISRCYLKNSIY